MTIRRTTRSLCIIAAGIGAMMPVLVSAQPVGAVFVMTNAAGKNEIISYVRDADGSLTGAERYETGGHGSGGVIAPLGSQGALTLSQDHTILFAVNAGGGTVTEFRVEGSKLTFLDKARVSGSGPVAVAQQGTLVYVLDEGGQGSVAGFRLQFDGTLAYIKDSTRYLTDFGGGSGPGSLSFSPNGHFLLVTERNTNSVDSFPIRADGSLGAEVTTPSLGAEPFAGEFAPSGFAVVAEAVGSVSSYSLGANGKYTGVSQSVPTEGAATCWIIVTPNGKYVYTSNTATANISGFSISGSGTLTPIGDTVVATVPTGGFNLDLATSSDGKYLYTLVSAAGAINAFAIESDGSLTNAGETTGLPKEAGFQGIAAY